MYVIGICGHMGNLLDGQTIKTKIFASELEKKFSKKNIKIVDLQGGWRKAFNHVWNIFQLVISCRNIIIFPAQNAVRILGPLLFVLNLIYNRTLHYVVVGGWLPSFLERRKWLIQVLIRFDYIYVETMTMKSQLERMGFVNLVLLPNCKKLNFLNKEQLITDFVEPYPLCILSRINLKKGIEDAVNILIDINEKFDRVIFCLDIYGPIEDAYKGRFNFLINNFPHYIQYKGTVSFEKTVEVLKNYYALLFPTHYFTEGIPGTIIDAFSAGVPVISSKWESFSDIIEENIVGKGYEFDNCDALRTVLLSIIDKPDELIKMRPYCLKKAEDFSVERIVAILINNIK